MTKYLVRVCAATVCVFWLGTWSQAGDENADRARALIALAKAKGPRVAPAPAPREKVTTYPEGYRKATTDVQPLVVFVGCDLCPVKGAVVARAESFAGVEPPAVVVGYPVSDRLFISATLGGNATAKEVQAAADTAAKKIDAPPAKDMPAPVPIDWQIRVNEREEFAIGSRRVKGGCACGEKCPCVEAKIEAKTVPVPVMYREVVYRDQYGRTWRQLEPVSASSNSQTHALPGTIPGGSTCPNGRCPLPR